MNSKCFGIIEQEQMSNKDKDQISYIGQVLNFQSKSVTSVIFTDHCYNVKYVTAKKLIYS